MSSPVDAFQNLSRIFATRCNRILEIEILPPAFGPFLEDGCSVGITKKYLVQAFVTARSIFFENSIGVCDSSATSLDNNEGPTWMSQGKRFDDFNTSSEIMLLFDCEHLTACNWRKKRLAGYIRRYELEQENDALEQLLQALEGEISLMTSFLCSPLHRHTKSPTLWQHRFWVLNAMLHVRGMGLKGGNSQILGFAGPGLSLENGTSGRETIYNLLKSELRTVLRAGELHPKNYYAFSYMRQLLGILSDAMEEEQTSSNLLAQSIIEEALNWCQAHPTDVSGWMFSLYLLEVVQDRNIQKNVLNRVLRFALDIGWEGESFWTFVDLVVESFDLVGLAMDVLVSSPDVASTSTLGLVDDITEPRKSWKTWLSMAKSHWASRK
ncbi:hypothetical protein EYZ11_012301 [Aspergillus tanneri]|uniref:Uncharacterized protein n=1 Tax=Aspergillus tanneri TaxID=1220188 RepID=A0A4S3J0V5_9EURO|nr:uncharacterized protein ATNIH1004_005091 [Aspergillus tanneri]KAA8649196.1 hypothetical protein ATNIH1004_005091 [Aspergillus tanneri]THC88255.1 hypothetical protein EYZ11_012301 [Aspergillus tanneri]